MQLKRIMVSAMSCPPKKWNVSLPHAGLGL